MRDTETMSQRGAFSSCWSVLGECRARRGVFGGLRGLFLGMESKEAQRDLMHRHFPDVLFVFMAFNHSLRSLGYLLGKIHRWPLFSFGIKTVGMSIKKRL